MMTMTFVVIDIELMMMTMAFVVSNIELMMMETLAFVVINIALTMVTMAFLTYQQGEPLEAFQGQLNINYCAENRLDKFHESQMAGDRPVGYSQVQLRSWNWKDSEQCWHWMVRRGLDPTSFPMSLCRWGESLFLTTMETVGTRLGLDHGNWGFIVGHHLAILGLIFTVIISGQLFINNDFLRDCYFNLNRRKMTLCDPGRFIMKEPGFSEFGMTLMSNIL